MPALILFHTYYPQNYAGIIATHNYSFEGVKPAK